VSKYFNETQKTEEWFAQEGLAKRQDVASILEDLRNPHPQNGDSNASGSPQDGLGDIAATVSSPVVLSGTRSGHYAMEAYRALRTRLMRLQASKGLRSVVMSSAIPGEGKTVTTLNLGLCYAQLHEMPVLLIDADLRTKRLSQLLENPSAPGLAEVLSGEARYEDVIWRTQSPNLHMLGAGSPVGSPPELFTGTSWSDLIVRCKERFKLILVDAPPVRPLADFELICAGCDAFVMVVRAFQTQREDLQQIAAQIDSKKLVGIVLNNAHTYSKSGYYNQYGSQVQS